MKFQINPRSNFRGNFSLNLRGCRSPTAERIPTRPRIMTLWYFHWSWHGNRAACVLIRCRRRTLILCWFLNSSRFVGPLTAPWLGHRGDLFPFRWIILNCRPVWCLSRDSYSSCGKIFVKSLRLSVRRVLSRSQRLSLTNLRGSSRRLVS